MTRNGPSSEVYAHRRRKVLERLDRGVLFIAGPAETVYSNDVHYPYRPDSYIRWLCGFEEPASVLLTNNGGELDGFTLCVRPRDAQAEIWTGERAGIEGARDSYGADHAVRLDEQFQVLEKALAKADRLFAAYSRAPSVNEQVLEVVHRVNAGRQRGGGDPITLVEAGALLDELRLIKEAEEIAILRRACEISAAAHRRVMESVRPGMHEYEVEALVAYELRARGCAGSAYPTIAAGGANATVLHYARNDKRLDDGELLLLDAGGEYGGYAADLTRTMPVGRSWSAAQERIYEAVLHAQKKAIAAIRPGVTHEKIHETAVEALVEGLLDAGLLEGTVSECVESTSYKRFFPHGTGHWLGLDVHDVGAYRCGEQSRALAPGIVMTVEPGIYVREDSGAPPPYRGMGVRIEDDVVVTDSGCEVLTGDVPKERREIAALRVQAFRSAA